jgi:hypothetical protein
MENPDVVYGSESRLLRHTDMKSAEVGQIRFMISSLRRENGHIHKTSSTSSVAVVTAYCHGGFHVKWDTLYSLLKALPLHATKALGGEKV